MMFGNHMIRTTLALVVALWAAPASAGMNNPTGVFGTTNQITCSPNYGKAVCALANPLRTPGPVTVSGKLTVTQGAANTNVLASTGYSLTGSDASSMVDLAGTWNTTGTPTAFKLNVTNTASNTSSLLMDLQTGGVSQFSVRKDGNGAFAGVMSVGASAWLGWAGSTRIYSSSDGKIRMLNSAQNSFVSLALGLETPSFPMWKRNGAVMEGKLADDSDYTQVRAAYFVPTGYTVATLPTGVTGALAYVTDATACTFLVAPTGGGSTYCPVTYNGSAWVAH